MQTTDWWSYHHAEETCSGSDHSISQSSIIKCSESWPQSCFAIIESYPSPQDQIEVPLSPCRSHTKNPIHHPEMTPCPHMHQISYYQPTARSSTTIHGKCK